MLRLKRCLSSSCLTISCLALAIVPDRARAQLPAPEPEPVRGAHMPALSPDGQRLAFVYRGDVWTAPATGGRATSLTSHVDLDAYPVWSPDGRWIAFASHRNGNWDLFVVPADGGATRQLTWHAGHEIPTGWSPDGKELLFAGRRDTPNYALYALDVASLRPRVLAEDFAVFNSASFSPDGRSIVYGRYGAPSFPWTRPRYHGSAATTPWLLDLEKNTRRVLATNEFQHLWTRFLPGGKEFICVTCAEVTPSASELDGPPVKWVDNPARTPNLWAVDLNGRRRQLTDFIGGAVRWPSVAAKTGDIAFEYGPELYRLRAGKKKPEKITLLAAGDEKQNTQRRERLTTGVTEAEPSPDGKTVAFGLRGDIWTIAVTKPKGVAARNAGFANRLTDWAGDDSDFVWSADGKKLFFTSDRDANTRLYELELASRRVRPLWTNSADVSSPRLSPDGRLLGFLVAGKAGGIYVLNLTNDSVRRLVHVPGPQWRGMGSGEFVWSPDMRWLVFTRRDESRAWNIFVMPAEGGTPTNITRLYARHSQPVWAPDGRYLFFVSNREGPGLYALPLLPETIRADDSDVKMRKGTNAPRFDIDFNDPSERIRKWAGQYPQDDLTISPEGAFFYLAEGDVWSLSFDGKEPKRLTTGGGKGGLRLTHDAKKVFYQQNGEIWSMPPDGKSPEKITFTADWDRDVLAERTAAFRQFWRSYHRGFYDGNFHGRDWDGIRRQYEPLLDSVETPEEFAILLNMMVGELEASHSEVTSAGGGTPGTTTPHLGFSFDYTHTGAGIKVRDVPEGAPGSFEQTRIRPGEYVLAINGQDVRLDEHLYELMNDKQGRDFEFLVGTNLDRKNARTVRYKVLTGDEWRQIDYRNRVEQARKRVDQRSRGRVGYLHLAAMGGENRVEFEREAYAQVAGKDALIIDVRFNSGGNIADSLIDWLERRPHGYVRSRDSETELSPAQAWTKPIVVLINEHSYSNAELFASAVRTRRLGRLVGQPTPGYVIWTDGLKLVDGTNARMPQSGAWRLDGTPFENNGEVPEVPVPLSPEDRLNGRDPQLDKALELLGHGKK